MANIPLFHCAISDEVIAKATAVMQSGQLASGPHVAALEEEISAFMGGLPAVAMGDMTHALTVALQLAGVGRGDEVLTLSYNCLSSNGAISAAGAVPVWIDIDPQSASFSPEDAATALTPRTKAVVVYHVAGYPADLTTIRRFCDEHGLPLIEDANNALGATFDGAPIGTIGNFAVFSFYANRQINAIDGAILVTKNSAHAAEARKLRRFGIDVARFRDANGEINPETDIPVIGTSSPLTNFNAILAREGLMTLSARVRRNRENVRQLEEAITGLEGIRSIQAVPGAQPCYWVWLVYANDRDKLMKDLKAAGIGCSKLHQANHIYTGFHTSIRPLPGTEQFMENVLAIPCGWWLDCQAITHIAETVRNCLLRS
jgi:dTDP-4-amino-4,6-dideoxygalactose transaminase